MAGVALKKVLYPRSARIAATPINGKKGRRAESQVNQRINRFAKERAVTTGGSLRGQTPQVISNPPRTIRATPSQSKFVPLGASSRSVTPENVITSASRLTLYWCRCTIVAHFLRAMGRFLESSRCYKKARGSLSYWSAVGRFK